MIPVEVKVDASTALARFSNQGIPEAVRRNLRQVLPDLTKRLGALVDEKLSTQLKSRNRLETKTELVENPMTVTGRVRVIAKSPPAMLPRWLESGTRAHPIAARTAPVLAFYWEKLGRMVFFKQIKHPGFKGIAYMENSFKEMEGEIIEGIRAAVREGLK